jgi:membrane-bound lytic murein transglycosylase D
MEKNFKYMKKIFDKCRNAYLLRSFYSGPRKSLLGFFSIASILLLVLGINTAAAQEDGGRPLRSVPPNSRSANYLFLTSRFSFLVPTLSLMTPSALEHPLTRHYIAQYSSTGGVALLNSVMERGNIYMPFIKEEIARRNLPPELAYLPIVESGFQITARSRSGAMGLWQFMLNSISPYDIRVTDFLDERRDFIKSTRGALQKLEDNYRTLGSWELALAAYNAGLGAVNRIIQRTGSRDYWELVEKNELKRETAHYVPKLIAAAYILSQPRRYGINIWHNNFEWTAIPLPRQISIDMLADETGIDRDLLRRLNAELLHGISPVDSNYLLKVPAARLEQIADVLEREDLRLIRYHYHIVRNGDTLWSITRHYGASQNIIEQHNPGVAGRFLRIGETIIIPAFGDVAPMVRTAVTRAFSGSHTVQRGETFWSLSRMYGVDPQDLAEANGMQLNQILHEGRTIKVPIIE